MSVQQNNTIPSCHCVLVSSAKQFSVNQDSNSTLVLSQTSLPPHLYKSLMPMIMQATDHHNKEQNKQSWGKNTPLSQPIRDCKRFINFSETPNLIKSSSFSGYRIVCLSQIHKQEKCLSIMFNSPFYISVEMCKKNHISTSTLTMKTSVKPHHESGTSSSATICKLYWAIYA